MMNMAEALPPSVDIYKKTYDDLIHAAVNEYEVVLSSTSASNSSSISGFKNMGKDPTKTVNEYNRISNTRMESLDSQNEAIMKSADDFEVAFARLRTLLEQSK